MISIETDQELVKLLNNQGFISAASQCQTEAELINIAKQFGLTLSEENLAELFAKKPDTIKVISDLADTFKKLDPLLKNKKIAEEFSRIASLETFQEFCKKNDIELTDSVIAIVSMLFDLLDEGIELSDESLDSVAGGSALWSMAEFGAGMIPGIGGVASAVVSIADGSVKGTEKITARLAAGVAVSLFESISTMSTGGALAIGKQWYKEGFTSDVKQKLAMFGGIKALSSITSFAVGRALS